MKKRDRWGAIAANSLKQASKQARTFKREREKDREKDMCPEPASYKRQVVCVCNNDNKYQLVGHEEYNGENMGPLPLLFQAIAEL